MFYLPSRFVCFFFLLHFADAFLNLFTRSESTQAKERCGHSVLLNNNYWLLKQTHQALEAIRNDQISFESLPWNRLSLSIRQIANACRIDERKYANERMHLHQLALDTGTILAKKAKAISYPSLIEIPRN